ncbi:MAG: STN domain-containing protein, partial [Armatimonadetes bacterium]|nr:STN domain-containing protein [Armatimonadota bacterium]
MRVRSLWLAAMVLTMAAAVAAMAEEDQPARILGANKVVNLELKDTPVKEAIELIFQGSGLKYYISPGVSGRVVELKLAGVTVDEAINALVEAAGLTLKVQDGTYIIATPTRVTVSKSKSLPPQALAAQQQLEPDQSEPKSSESSPQ